MATWAAAATWRSLSTARSPRASASARKASFQVPAGEHVVGIGIDTQDDTLCGKGLLNRELRTRIAADGNARFRIVSEASSGFDIRTE